MGSATGRAAEADVKATFGVMTMVVNLYTGESTTEKKSTQFRNCCPTCYEATKDAVRLGVNYVCSEDSTHGPFTSNDVVKGSEDDEGIITIVGTAEEVAEARSEAVGLEKKEMAIDFMLADDVEANFFPADKTWVVQPVGKQPLFSMLMALMDEDGKVQSATGDPRVAVASIRMRDKEHVGMVSRWGEQMVFVKLFRPADTKTFPAPQLSEVSEKNLDMGRTLIDNLTVDFDADSFVDGSRERIKAWKAARQTGVTIQVAPQKASKDPDEDLGAMLEAMAASVKAS